MPIEIPLPRTDFSAADIEFALNCVHLLVRGAGYAELKETFEAQPEPYRSRLISLERDVLCGYPEVTYGVPLLIHAESSDGVIRPMQLPLPHYQPPETSVESCSWLGLDTLRSQAGFGEPGPAVTIFSGRIAGAVLLLRCRSEDPPQIGNEWYGDMFDGLPGQVTIHTLAPQPWPDAVEAAAAMLAGARPGPAVDTPQCFLDFAGHFAAQDAGRRFYRRVIEHDGTSGDSALDGAPGSLEDEDI